MQMIKKRIAPMIGDKVRLKSGGPIMIVIALAAQESVVCLFRGKYRTYPSIILEVIRT
jgi:hypothetical protein